MDKTGCYEFMAEPFHCDFSGRLFMGHLGNHMLNAADFHSSALMGVVASGYRDGGDAQTVYQVQC